MKRTKVPAVYWHEALEDAAKYKAQAERLFAALKRTETELGEEIYKLQRDLAWAMDANACLALELSEKDHELLTLKGEC